MTKQGSMPEFCQHVNVPWQAIAAATFLSTLCKASKAPNHSFSLKMTSVNHVETGNSQQRGSSPKLEAAQLVVIT
jgi:hypothetical protein